MRTPIRTSPSLPQAVFERRFLLELRLLHGYLENLTSTLSEGIDPAKEARFLPAIYEVHCLAGAACAELDLALTGREELEGLETCLEAAKACLHAARRCEPDDSLRELGESMRLIGLCSVSLVCSALGEVERRAGTKPFPSARTLSKRRSSLLAAV